MLSVTLIVDYYISLVDTRGEDIQSLDRVLNLNSIAERKKDNQTGEKKWKERLVVLR